MRIEARSERITAGAPVWARLLLTVVVPAAMGVLLLLHPMGPFEIEGALDRWYVVHVPVILLSPLLAAGGWLLLHEVPGRAAAIGRWALLPFLAFYVAWEALAAIGTGWLVRAAGSMPSDAADAAAPIVDQWWEWVNAPHWLAVLGMGAWLAFGVSAAIAHRRAGARPAVVAALAIASLYAVMHGMIQGAVPLFAMAAAGWQLAWPSPLATAEPSEDGPSQP